MSVNFTSLRSYIFISFQQITFKVNNFTTDLRYFFQLCWRIFPNWSQSKVEKTMPLMEGSICKFSFPIMRKNCQIESDVCVCCKRDSKSPHCLSTHEQEKKAKKNWLYISWDFQRASKNKAHLIFLCAILLNRQIYFSVVSGSFSYEVVRFWLQQLTCSHGSRRSWLCTVRSWIQHRRLWWSKVMWPTQAW